MACKTYDLGDMVRVEGIFKDALTGQEMDPDTVNLTVWDADGTETVYEYGVDPEIDKDATGEYHSDISASAVGDWYYRWSSSGDGQAGAPKTKFTVEL
jgi:hypothetical protein